MRGFAILGVLGAIVACATLRQTGDPCGAGDARCVDEKTAFACRGKKVVAFDCNGPAHCSARADKTVLCDQSAGALPGTPCFDAYAGRAQCGAEAGAYLVCADGTWQPRTCEAGAVCRDDGAGVTCVATEGG